MLDSKDFQHTMQQLIVGAISMTDDPGEAALALSGSVLFLMRGGTTLSDPEVKEWMTEAAVKHAGCISREDCQTFMETMFEKAPLH